MHNCPCCGEITYNSALLCAECVGYECEMTVDACGEAGYWECQCPPVTTYETIVFCQGDDANEPLDVLYNWTGDRLHCHYSGVTSESIAAAFEYMAQWDYGDPAEECERPSADDQWVSDDGSYIMSAHLGLGYIGLVRVVVS